jgi:hypothetical protein
LMLELVVHERMEHRIWRTYIEKVKLVWVCGSNARCEQQKITLQPFDFERRKFKADTGTCVATHFVGLYSFKLQLF